MSLLNFNVNEIKARAVLCLRLSRKLDRDAIESLNKRVEPNKIRRVPKKSESEILWLFHFLCLVNITIYLAIVR
ncbi:hypothetical protein AR688_01805 [Rheinheimera sp. EpRS3]|nr:hypothetical protein AR688_01805 [Rheinheimera sp. EpRS3]